MLCRNRLPAVAVALLIALTPPYIDGAELFACQGKSLALSCPAGSFLRINQALFGRRLGESHCVNIFMMLFMWDQRPACGDFTEATKAVQAQCEGVDACTITADYKLFKDHCPGLYKYLVINYECSKDTKAPGNCIGGVQALYRAPGTIVSHMEFKSAPYYANMTCEWEIVAGEMEKVQITFTEFELEDKINFSLLPCFFDRIEVTTGTPEKRETRIYCGRHEKLQLISTDNYMRIKFITDKMIQKSGFAGEYSFIRRFNLILSPSCGIPPIKPLLKDTPRIMGGHDAVPYSWPWMTLLQDTKVGSSNFCGATLISTDWLLTAAHCIDPVKNRLHDMKVTVGKHNFDEKADVTTGFIQTRRIGQAIIHEDFDIAALNYDIALIRVTPPVELSDAVYPVCLPGAERMPIGHKCYITGWGSTQNDPLYLHPFPLLQAKVEAIDWSKCNGWYEDTLTTHQMCAGYERGGVDTCQGDSGGPLQCQFRGRFELRGITSFGQGCGNPFSPGVYTDVSRMITWIEDKLIPMDIGQKIEQYD